MEASAFKYRPALLIGKIYYVINIPPYPPPTKKHLKKKVTEATR